MSGLPPDANVWRQGRLTGVEDKLATLIERHDAWASAQYEIALRPQLKNPPDRLEPTPGVVTFARPGVDPEPDATNTADEMTAQERSLARAAYFTDS